MGKFVGHSLQFTLHIKILPEQKKKQKIRQLGIFIGKTYCDFFFFSLTFISFFFVHGCNFLATISKKIAKKKNNSTSWYQQFIKFLLVWFVSLEFFLSKPFDIRQGYDQTRGFRVMNFSLVLIKSTHYCEKIKIKTKISVTSSLYCIIETLKTLQL